MDDLCTAGDAAGELDDLLEAFTGYLRRERSLASTTVENYLNQVRPFVTWYCQHRQSTLAG
ncbi:MAG: site-specific integrase [Actinobacteria bacterium]|nr:site-specific integrase [Actinomycetota bacterium]